MRAWVAVTNLEWYDFLRARPGLPLVNFWKPSAAPFRAVEEGEDYIVFKAKRPLNRVVGGGVYGGYATSRLLDAWMMFGDTNGAAMLADLTRLTGKAPEEQIGCTFVRNPVFFSRQDAFPVPPDWSSNLQTGKRYDISDPRYAAYFAALLPLISRELGELAPMDTEEDDRPVFGVPHLTPTRLRQNEFHAVVASAYHERCAISGSRIRPALQAAHILPVTQGGKNRVSNGLLLRSDVHAMFDGGYLAVDPAYRLRVSPRLRNEFGNGDWFYDHEGADVALPDHRGDQPRREFLKWHLDTVFKSS